MSYQSNAVVLACLAYGAIVAFVAYIVLSRMKYRFGMKDMLCCTTLIALYLPFYMEFWETVTQLSESVKVFLLPMVVGPVIPVGLTLGLVHIGVIEDSRQAYCKDELVEFLPMRWCWPRHFMMAGFSILLTYSLVLLKPMLPDLGILDISFLIFYLLASSVVFYHAIVVLNSKVDLHEEGVIIRKQLFEWDDCEMKLKKRLRGTFLSVQRVVPSLTKPRSIPLSPFIPEDKVEEIQRIIDENQNLADQA